MRWKGSIIGDPVRGGENQWRKGIMQKRGRSCHITRSFPPRQVKRGKERYFLGGRLGKVKRGANHREVKQKNRRSMNKKNTQRWNGKRRKVWDGSARETGEAFGGKYETRANGKTRHEWKRWTKTEGFSRFGPSLRRLLRRNIRDTMVD